MPICVNRSGFSSGLLSGDVHDHKIKTFFYLFIYSKNILTTSYRPGTVECNTVPVLRELVLWVKRCISSLILETLRFTTHFSKMAYMKPNSPVISLITITRKSLWATMTYIHLLPVFWHGIWNTCFFNSGSSKDFDNVKSVCNLNFGFKN